MDFEFGNSVYTGLIGIFAAVMGIAYPLILQSLEKIDTRYNSTRLTKCFEEDKRFKHFNRSLRISIFFAFVTGFALCELDNIQGAQVFLLAIHSVVTLWLVMNTINLYRLFMDFFYPQKLLNYLKSLERPQLFEILDITYYAAVKENVELYNNSTIYIADTLIKINSDKKLQPYGRKVIEEILKRSSKKDTPQFLRIDNTGIMLYFDYQPLDYRSMWEILRQHIEQGNFDWLMNYWEMADQYYRRIVENTRDKEDAEYPSCFLENQTTKFKEFHIALGALMLHHKKEEWLHQMMRFTNIAPARYDLALCTFRGIFRWLRHFSESLHRQDFKDSLEYNYPIIFHTGVNGENIIYHHIVRYLAYSMLHLNELNYNVRYVETFELPYPCTNDRMEDEAIPTNKAFIQMAKVLKQYIYEVNKEIGQSCEVLQQAIAVIDIFIEECKSAIYNTLSQKEWSDEKEQHIKEQLVVEFNRQSRLIIKHEDANNDGWQKNEKIAECKVKIEFSDIFEGDYSYSINLEPTIVSLLIRNIQLEYNKLFILNHTSFNYKIRYVDIDIALERLQLSDQYVVIGMGIEIEHRFAPKTQAIIKDVISHSSEIIILKKSQLPYISFLYADTDLEGLRPIDRNKSFLYTNLDKLREAKQSDGYQDLFLNVAVRYILVIPPTIVKYIRIKISPKDASEKLDLDKITQVDTVLK